LSRGTRLGIALVIQILVLLGLVGYHRWSLVKGTPVTLVANADIGRLARGVPVALDYAIGELKLAQLDGAKGFDRRDPVYVVLEEEKGGWRAVGVYHRRPTLIEGQVLVRGWVAGVERAAAQEGDASADEPEGISAIRVRYGIENYRVPAEAVPKDIAKGAPLVLRVVINRFGDPAIAAVLVGDEPIYQEPSW
jgi:uncharacterized membrane-anchored protein